jgi:hypothetical protein
MMSNKYPQTGKFCQEFVKCIRRLAKFCSENSFDCITCSFKNNMVEDMKLINPLVDGFVCSPNTIVPDERTSITLDESSFGPMRMAVARDISDVPGC